MQAMKFDIFFVLLVVLPEIGLFIWGNTFIYSEDMSRCRSNHSTKFGEGEHVEQLWICSLAIIIYGYLFMLFSCIVLVLGAGMYATFKSWSVELDPNNAPTAA
jgi:hypothetical protein